MSASPSIKKCAIMHAISLLKAKNCPGCVEMSFVHLKVQLRLKIVLAAKIETVAVIPMHDTFKPCSQVVYATIR